MARTGRTPTTDAGIAKAGLFARLSAAVAHGAHAARLQALMIDDPEGMAACTGTALGGTWKASLTDAMTEAQDGRCFTCRRTLNARHANSKGMLSNLIPSVMGNDLDVTGDYGQRSAMCPGNVVVMCTNCNRKRNAYAMATGAPVCIMVKDMPREYQNMILTTWPSASKREAVLDPHEAQSDANRMAVFGF